MTPHTHTHTRCIVLRACNSVGCPTCTMMTLVTRNPSPCGTRRRVMQQLTVQQRCTTHCCCLSVCVAVGKTANNQERKHRAVEHKSRQKHKDKWDAVVWQRKTGDNVVKRIPLFYYILFQICTYVRLCACQLNQHKPNEMTNTSVVAAIAVSHSITRIRKSAKAPKKNMHVIIIPLFPLSLRANNLFILIFLGGARAATCTHTRLAGSLAMVRTKIVRNKHLKCAYGGPSCHCHCRRRRRCRPIYWLT